MVQKNVWIVLLLATALASCSEELNDDNSEEIVSDSASAETVADDSTRLSDHTLDEKTLLNMFQQFTLTVDLNQADMQGDFRFLKISDQLQNTLFLGQVALSGSVELPIDVSKNAFPINVEIFSELATDVAISYEVSYE